MRHIKITARAEFPVKPEEQFRVRDGDGNVVETWNHVGTIAGKTTSQHNYLVAGYFNESYGHHRPQVVERSGQRSQHLDSIHPRVIGGKAVGKKSNTSAKKDPSVTSRKIAAITAHLNRHPRDGASQAHLKKLQAA